MNVVEIKKSGIEGLVSGHTPRIPEEDRVLETHDNKLETVYDRFQSFLDETNRYAIPNNVQAINDLDDVLTSEEIDAFMQMTMPLEEHPEYRGQTGYFISRLIQNSYDAGHSEFTLHSTSEIDFLCSHLKTEDRPLEITLWGALGSDFGASCKGIHFTITGNMSYWCGVASIESTYNVYGDVGTGAGSSSKRSRFTISGDAGRQLGAFSLRSIFHIDGIVDDDCGKDSQQSIFSTSNSETLERMRIDVHGFSSVVFVESDGKEKKVRRPLRYIGAHIVTAIEEAMRRPPTTDYILPTEYI